MTLEHSSQETGTINAHFEVTWALGRQKLLRITGSMCNGLFASALQRTERAFVAIAAITPLVTQVRPDVRVQRTIQILKEFGDSIPIVVTSLSALFPPGRFDPSSALNRNRYTVPGFTEIRGVRNAIICVL